MTLLKKQASDRSYRLGRWRRGILAFCQFFPFYLAAINKNTGQPGDIQRTDYRCGHFVLPECTQSSNNQAANRNYQGEYLTQLSPFPFTGYHQTFKLLAMHHLFLCHRDDAISKTCVDTFILCKLGRGRDRTAKYMLNRKLALNLRLIGQATCLFSYAEIALRKASPTQYQSCARAQLSAAWVVGDVL